MRVNDKRAPLGEAFSLYLDLTRFTAAVLVVVAHYLQYRVIGGAAASFVPSMGREAVVVFFVLSGFVIAYVTDTKATSAKEYIAARCGRIYSVALPTLLLGWLIASILPAGSSYQLAKPYIYLPLHLLFLGQSWTLSEVPPMLGPYWSLYYEVWYYALFGTVLYLRGWRRIAAVSLVLAIMGFKLWLLLPVWSSGVLLYRLQTRVRMARSVARAGLVASILLLLAYNLTGMETVLKEYAVASWPFPELPLGSSERFLADYLVCLLVMFNFLCARNAGLDGLVGHAAHIRALAAYTFTLYLSHMLVILVWLWLYSHNNTSLFDIAGISIAVWLVTVVLAQLTERRKNDFRRPIDWMLGLAPRAKAS